MIVLFLFLFSHYRHHHHHQHHHHHHLTIFHNHNLIPTSQVGHFLTAPWQESRISNLVRWNAAVMVSDGNRRAPGAWKPKHWGYHGIWDMMVSYGRIWDVSLSIPIITIYIYNYIYIYVEISSTFCDSYVKWYLGELLISGDGHQSISIGIYIPIVFGFLLWDG